VPPRDHGGAGSVFELNHGLVGIAVETGAAVGMLHLYTCMHTYYVRTRTYTSTHVRTRTYTCVHVYTHKHTHRPQRR
jgi:hypothetical protein